MKKIIIIFCFLFGISSFSQIKISGKVTDSIGNPLELANIILIDADKENYINYFNKSVMLLNKKGMIIIKN